MLEHLLAPENLPFAVTLLITIALGVLEIVTALFGATLSGMVDAVLPDLDLDADVGGPDASAGTDLTTEGDLDGVHTLGVIGHALDWLHVGRVPTLLLLLTLLGSFGAFGLLLQSFAKSALGGLAPAWLMSIPAFALAVPAVRVVGSVFARLIPKEETSAVSRDSFVGQPALVTAGVATLGNPAQAKLMDRHGQMHYLLVEPETTGVELVAGSTVILTRHQGAVFKAIPNDVPELTLGSDAR
jgi:hypothetical protein